MFLLKICTWLLRLEPRAKPSTPSDQGSGYHLMPLKSFQHFLGLNLFPDKVGGFILCLSFSVTKEAQLSSTTWLVGMGNNDDYRDQATAINLTTRLHFLCTLLSFNNILHLEGSRRNPLGWDNSRRKTFRTSKMSNFFSQITWDNKRHAYSCSFSLEK